MKDYWNRIVDRELELRLEAFGATLIVGPKWCGKTTTAEEKAKSVLKKAIRKHILYAGKCGFHFHLICVKDERERT